MNILAISHEFPPIGGGGSNAALELTRRFTASGHTVTLITSNYKNMASCEQINGVNVNRVDSLRKRAEQCSFKEMLSFIFKAYPVAKKLCKNHKFDVCFIFFGIPSGPIGYLLKKRFKIPYVIRFGGGDIPGFQERFTKIYKLIGPAIKLIWKNADKRVANSEGLKELAYEFCDKYPFDIITNGVDTGSYVPGEKKEDGPLRVLFVSRLIERKGLQYVIPQLKNLDVTLTVVGDGPYRQELVDTSLIYKVDHKINFVGQKNKDEIAQYYADADLFILPSAKEGMPNVVLEAMAAGLPIIMTPCQGSKELISDDNGFVVSKEQFGDCISTLDKDRQLLRTMGENSRRKAEEKFSWDSTAAAYMKMFEEL